MDPLCITTRIPPSVNMAFRDGEDGRRHLSKDAAQYKKGVTLLASNAAALAGWRYVPGQRLAVCIRLSFRTNQRRDIANCEKLAVDAIAKALGFDDSVIDDLHLLRMPCDPDNPRCEVELRIIDAVEPPPAPKRRTPRAAV